MFAPDIRLNTRMPQPKRSDIYIPSDEDIERLIRTIEGEEIEKAVLLAAFGSLRRSECCALTADDIEGSVVKVRRAMVWTKDRIWDFKQPKSKAGYRDVTLPDFVIDKLVPREQGSRIVSLVPTSVTNAFARSLRKAGLPHFRFHDLRHYQASILHAMGVPDKYIMARGGWKTDSTLKNIYQHTMSDKRKQIEDDICQKFAERFG